MGSRLLFVLIVMTTCINISNCNPLDVFNQVITNTKDKLTQFLLGIPYQTIGDISQLIDVSTSGVSSIMQNLYHKQENYVQKLNEQYLNVLLELNGIDGRFNEASALIEDLNGNIIDVRDMLQQLDEKFDNVTNLLTTLDDKMFLFSSQLSDISSQLATQTLELTMTVKFQTFVRLINEFDRYYSRMQLLIAAYHTNHPLLIHHIDLLIDEFRVKNVANQMMQYLTMEFVGTKSFVDSFIEYVYNRKTVSDAAPNKMVYDFFIFALNAVQRSFAMLDTCYMIKDEILGETYTESHFYVALNRRTIITDIVTLLRKSLTKIDSALHMENYMNFQVTGDANPHRFENVRKVFIRKTAAQPGYVVTGVRFRVHQGILFLQIQVGRLLMMGMIDQSSLHWQALPETIDESDFVQMDAGSMYFGMDKYFFTDRFITGIKILTVSNVIRLHLYGKKVEMFGLGLMKASDFGMASSILAYNETTLTGSMQGLSPNSNNAQFKITNDKVLVLNQSLATYLDGSDINFDVKAPLAGIGFYHYTNDENYSGFIRPYVVALNYTNLINNIN